MVDRYLITTADERTWPDKQLPVLFLGEWCRKYDRKEIWQELNAEIVPYHWDDRQKLYSDYLYLQNLYEELLAELRNKLNSIHNVSYSLRYWRIILGPWLGYFMQILFDRWAMIEIAIKKYNIQQINVLKNGNACIVPNDMEDFRSILLEDAWNEAIYGEILSSYTDIPLSFIEATGIKQTLSNKKSHVPFRRRMRKLVAKMFFKISGIVTKEEEAFLISSYLPRRQDFILQCKLKQFPKWWGSVKPVTIEKSERNWSLGDTKGGFEGLIRVMISRHIPSLYLEGYAALKKQIKGLPWPANPKVIFTSNSYNSDDVFKAWAAEKTETGTPLIIGQHGGGLGTSLWAFYEEHQIAISDLWLSWGWDKEGHPAIKPVANLKTANTTQKWDPNGILLLVTMTLPRYSYHMFSGPIASQWLNYFEDQCLFIRNLNSEIQKKIIARLYVHDYGWCQKQRWEDELPGIKLDEGKIPLTKLVAKARLFVSTYNATTFLESLSLNIPTIMFWNPDHWEIREEAVVYFERLKKVGILHESSGSAAGKVSEIWNDVAGWWNIEEVQEARNFFCNRFSRTTENAVEQLKDVLTKIKPC